MEKHKVRITTEAQFDYEHCVCSDRKLPEWRDVLISINPIRAILYMAETEYARRKLQAVVMAEKRYRGKDTARLNIMFDAIESASDNYRKAVSNLEYAEMLEKAFKFYDKYDEPLRKMRYVEIRQYAENFIEEKEKKKGLNNACYLKVQYYDDRLDEWLLLFLKKAEQASNYRIWDIIGICEDDAFDDSHWGSGAFKAMFSLTDKGKDDWVVDMRICKMRHDKEVERWLGNKNVEEFMVKDLLKNYKMYRAETAIGKKKGLIKQLDLLDKCIDLLWDEQQKRVVLQYLELGSIAKAAKMTCLTKSGARYHFDKAAEILELLMVEE